MLPGGNDGVTDLSLDGAVGGELDGLFEPARLDEIEAGCADSQSA